MASELYTMNPVGARKKRRKSTKARARPRKRRAVATTTAPARRRKRRAASPKVVYRTMPRKKRGRRKGGFARAGKGMTLKNFMALAQTGAMQGAGALATEVAMGFVRPMLPAALGFGPGRHLTRIGLGLLLGNLLGRVNKRFADAVTIGTATVAGFDFAKEFIGPMLPAGMVLGEYPDMLGVYTQGPGAIGYVGAGSSPVSEMGNVNENAYYY